MKEFCVDLQLAKELKENGFPQNTKYRYDICNNNVELTSVFVPLHDHVIDVYSAPISDEILKELPTIFENYELIIKKLYLYYQIMYIEEQDGEIMNDYALFEDKRFSNALAKTYIYLKKEGYIK